MSPKTLQINLEEWESHSGGLILFDSSGNFLSCSAKTRRLAGSESAIRAALETASWPRDFACGEEIISVAARALALGSGQPQTIEIGCVRTTGGFIAILAPEPRMAPQPPDSLVEIFASLMRERRAISRHLHGALTQDLVALSFSLSGIAEDHGASLSSAILHVERCCRGVRALSYALSPPSFLEAGLIETIGWYGEVLHADAGIHFTIDADSLPSDPPATIKELLFAALQHVAAAAIWQAARTCVRVAIRYDGKSILLRVEGVCSANEPQSESPLVRERARAMGGETRFTVEGDEYLLEIRLPWGPAAQEPGTIR